MEAQACGCVAGRVEAKSNRAAMETGASRKQSSCKENFPGIILAVGLVVR